MCSYFNSSCTLFVFIFQREDVTNFNDNKSTMKKKKEHKTIVQQKMFIVNQLIDNNFRCKDEDGEFLSATQTDDILMNMPLNTLEHIRNDYQHIIDERKQTLKAIKPIYNAVMLKTGLGHFMRL